MLGIPFLSTYIQRIVKVQSVADSVDWLNYYCTSLLLAFFSLAISAKQYFGSPIQCWVPNEFKSSWEKYAENYCFIANSYFVPLEQEVPTELANRHDQISYYRWVPVALAIQALFFWLPNWLWNMLHKQTAINPRAMLAEAGKSRALHGAQREKEVEGLAAFLSDTLNIFWKENGRRHSLSGLNATLLYLAIKLLYVLNCFGQLILLNRFLGGKYHSWAWESFLALLRGEEWQESAVFPRQILCDFSVRLLANNHRHTIQCVIMLNLINEKLYFFLHFWLLLVGIVTLINFFYYLLILMLASLRTEFVKRNINKRQQKLRGFGTRELTRFVQTRLRPDGVLLLHFIRQHIGGRVTYELLNELLRLHWLIQTTGSTSSTQTGHLTTSNSPNSEKVPEMRRTMNNGLGEELDEEEEGGINGERQMDPLMDGYSRQNTYKPTAYGPGALVYPGAEPIDGHHNHRLRPHLLATAPHPPFSPSSLLRAISGTASPTTLLMANGNHYTAPPTLEFIDGQSNETVKNIEEGEEGMKVVCPICHCSFNNSYDLMIHEKTNHAQSAFIHNSDGDGDVEKQLKEISSPNGTTKLRKSVTSAGQLPPMNTTPLTQSRRAKSPLVTGLGTMGKRQGNNVEMPKNNNSADDESFLVKPMEEIEKINNSAV